MKQNCEDCMNFLYDEEYDEYTCVINMDEDEIESFYSKGTCPYFKFGDEYKIVNKQI